MTLWDQLCVAGECNEVLTSRRVTLHSHSIEKERRSQTNLDKVRKISTREG